MNTSSFRQICYEALHFVISPIQKRFDQPNYKTYDAFEEVLMKTANNEDFEEVLMKTANNEDFEEVLMKTANNEDFEEVLMKTANNEDFSKGHTLVTDFVPERLKRHLNFFTKNFTILPKANLLSTRAHLQNFTDIQKKYQ